jgi:hypothetical protein
MRGWKSYLGAAIALASAALAMGNGDVEQGLQALGVALGIIGIRAKQERSAPGK